MLNLDEIKKEIQDFKNESSEINSKLENEKKRSEKQLEDLKKDFNEKVKKAKSFSTTKIQSMEKRLTAISDRKKNIAGYAYMEFIHGNVTQEQLDELTIMMKD